MRFLSLCSGIEAASVAWKSLGWEAVGFAEIEPFPSAVLAHHYPKTKNYGDITKHKEWGIEPGTVDLVCGGPPCQAFSIAGQRAGMADPRGNLTLTYLALVDHLKPRWIVYENVPGLLSSNGGADFARFIEGLALCGYHCAWRVYDPAQSFGRHRLPQRRRRVFLVGYLGAWEPPASVLFKPQSCGGDSAEGNTQGQDPASGPVASPGAGGCWWDGGQVSQCLDASVAKRQTMPDKNRFPAVLEPLAFDGYNQTVSQTSQTIRADKCDSDHIGMILEPITFQPSNLMRVAGAYPNTKHTSTLKAGMGDQMPHICHPVILDRASFNQGENAQYEPKIEETETSPTVIARGPHAVAQPPAYAVRRLTVNECLRLQGFPDNYTAIPWRGKPADQCPDGPQYKAIGNSWAVTVARHIGEQIQLWESNHKTQ